MALSNDIAEQYIHPREAIPVDIDEALDEFDRLSDVEGS